LKRYFKSYCRKEFHSKHGICESLAHKVERKNPVFANILEIKIILMPGPGMKYVVCMKYVGLHISFQTFIQAHVHFVRIPYYRCHETFSEEKYVNISSAKFELPRLKFQPGSM
jgi:hypothetical protein